MHILEIPDSPETAAKAGIKPGKYIVEDNNGCELMLTHQDLRPTLTPIVKMGPHSANDKVLIIGSLGYGDALMLIPVLREIKKRNPDAEIHLSCFEWTRQVFFNLPYVSGFVDYPPKLELAQDFGTVLFIEGSIEFNMMARVIHLTDRFAQHLGVAPLNGNTDWTDNKKPEFILSSDERDWAIKTFPKRLNRRRLGLQVQAGTRVRSYPMAQLAGARKWKIEVRGSLNRQSMLADMIEDGWDIGLIGNPGEFRVDGIPKEMTDVSRFGLTFRQSAAYLTTCDAVLAPDSSMMHLAGTLDIPCVALFGPFPYKLRTAYYPTVFALTGNGVCPMAPCFHTFHNGLPLFPKGGPCEQSGRCDELAAIDPERIRAKLNQLVPAAV